MNQQELWKQLYEVITYHRKSDHGYLKTLNRLFREALRRYEDSEVGVPALSAENVHLLQEEWSTERLVALLTPDHCTTKKPHGSGPVIVVRRERREYLIDGRKRINSWRRNDDRGSHCVIIAQLTTFADTDKFR